MGASVDYALIPIDSVQMNWCDEIVCMDENQKARIVYMFKDKVLDFEKKNFVVLDIEDRYAYRDPELIGLITSRYNAATGFRPFEEITSFDIVECS